MIPRSRSQAFGTALAILALAVPAARAAELDPVMRERIAAIANEGEGAAVTEELLRRHEGSGPAARARKAALEEAAAVAAPFLDESVRKADWNESHMGIDGPVCFDGAPKLGLMFRAKGIPVYTATTGSHVFLIANFPEAMFVVDPTIRQYFGQDLAPSWVPQVFVGTVSELAALYARDPGLPVLPYRKIYFNLEWPASRKDSMIIGKRDKFLWSTSSAEYAPLTAYFNAEARRSRHQTFGDAARPAQFRDWARLDRAAGSLVRPGR
jgi:hypothetical protein